MAEKVQKIGIKRESGYLYFIDKNGDISRSLMARGGDSGDKASKVVKFVGLNKEKGYLYFIDKNGDISRSLMARGGKRKTVRKTVRKSKRK
ncbi:MAG: hypothetical protein LBS47_00465 [Endomicrobium sp.]|jgi:hypothetical protein|nr:hypothetical protein [Endomicrobium sp.]